MSLYNAVGYIQDGSLFITKNGWCCILVYIIIILAFNHLVDLFVNLWFFVLDKVKKWRRKKCDSKK